MSVVLVPIIKDKSGTINKKDNYRPVDLASVVSTIIDYTVRRVVIVSCIKLQSTWVEA